MASLLPLAAPHPRPPRSQPGPRGVPLSLLPTPQHALHQLCTQVTWLPQDQSLQPCVRARGWQGGPAVTCQLPWARALTLLLCVCVSGPWGSLRPRWAFAVLSWRPSGARLPSACSAPASRAPWTGQVTGLAPILARRCPQTALLAQPGGLGGRAGVSQPVHVLLPWPLRGVRPATCAELALGTALRCSDAPGPHL